MMKVVNIWFANGANTIIYVPDDESVEDHLDKWEKSEGSKVARYEVADRIMEFNLAPCKHASTLVDKENPTERFCLNCHHNFTFDDIIKERARLLEIVYKDEKL